MDRTLSSIAQTSHLRISDIIAPWRSSRSKPPFSVEELVAMALLCQDNPITPREILKWINANFPFYADKITDAFWDPDEGPYRYNSEHVKFITDLQAHVKVVLHSYEFPSYVNSLEGLCRGWTINQLQGAELIRPLLNKLNPSAHSNLGFFDLPAELRNEVYGSIFQYPTEPGLKFSVIHGKPAQRFEIVNETSKLRGDGITVRWLQNLSTRPMGRILEPLRTCRQVYQEAMPMFYRNNHFRFNDLDDLNKFLCRIPRKRTTHLSHITIAYPRRDRVIADLAFQNLKRVEHLRILNIRVEETSLLRWARAKAGADAMKVGDDPRKAEKRYQSALDMPGMDILRSIRGLDEVNVYGIRKDTVLPQTVSTLKADLTRAKEVVKPKSKLKKRKIDEFETIEISSKGLHLNPSMSKKRKIA